MAPGTLFLLWQYLIWLVVKGYSMSSENLTGPLIGLKLDLWQKSIINALVLIIRKPSVHLLNCYNSHYFIYCWEARKGLAPTWCQRCIPPSLFTEEVYMSQLLGFKDSQHPDYVCRLLKDIYSLKQALWAWYSALKVSLIDHGYFNSKVDKPHYLFITLVPSYHISLYMLITW